MHGEELVQPPVRVIGGGGKGRDRGLTLTKVMSTTGVQTVSRPACAKPLRNCQPWLGPVAHVNVPLKDRYRRDVDRPRSRACWSELSGSVVVNCKQGTKMGQISRAVLG